MVFENLMDPVFSPLLNLNPIVSVGIVSLIITVIITLIYKYTTDQNLMKRLKDEMKELQKEMKELKDNPDKMMKVQKQAMETNMKYMMQSFRSTIFTLLPVLLIFGWMNANYAFDAISPGEQFTVNLDFKKGTVGEVVLTVPKGMEAIGDSKQQIVDNKAIFNLKGIEGNYIEDKSLKFEYANKTYYKEVIVTYGQDYAKKEEAIKKSNLLLISIDYGKKIILPYINWGWLGTYIIFSIIFSMLLRKWLKVY